MKRSGGLLRDMSIFVRIVEAQSLTDAARALGLPKSTVSRRLDALEASLGVRLVVRNNRGLSVTELGMAYFHRAQRVLGLAEDALQAVVGEERLQGLLRITAPRATGSQVVSDVLASFLRAHPEVSAELVLTDRRVDLLQGRFDLAVRIGRVVQAPEGYETQQLMPTWIVLCASPAYLARRGVPKTPAELAAHEAIRVGILGGSRWRLRSDAGLAEVDVSGRVVLDDMSMAERAVRAGLGIAPMAAAIALPLVRQGLLTRVLERWSFEARTMFAVYPVAARRPPRTTRLVEHMMTHLRAEIAERIGPASAPVPFLEHAVPPPEPSAPEGAT